MTTEQEIVSRLMDSLRSTLPRMVNITPAFASASIEGLGSNPRADIVVSGDNRLPVIIQIKNSGKNQDLPLATAHVTKTLYQANADVNPKIVLITNSKISKLLQRELDEQHVKIFKLENFENLVKQLADFILKE